MYKKRWKETKSHFWPKCDWRSTQLKQEKNFIAKALKMPRKPSDQNKVDLHQLKNGHLYFFCFQSWSRLHTCRWQIQRNSPPRPLFRPLIDWVDNICHTCHCCTKKQLYYTQIYYIYKVKVYIHICRMFTNVQYTKKRGKTLTIWLSRKYISHWLLLLNNIVAEWYFL